MRYNPALDGLRALAVLAVVGVHCSVPGFGNGAYGVDVFFVLSGYLITRLLAEKQPTLREFYLRRLKRLTPALGLFLCVYVVLGYTFVPNYDHAGDAAYAALYLSDYQSAFWNVPHYLGHLWSLSVEEHFYLLWPLLFYRFRPSWRVLLVVYVAAIAWRWWPEQTGHYFRFDTRLSGLVLGCALASVRLNLSAGWGLVALAALVALGPEASRPEGLVMVELAAAVAVAGRHPAWLGTPALAYLGKLSYGIYLWHAPIAVVMADRPWQVNLAVTLPLSIALAALSYHTVEAWVRSARRRERLSELDVVDNASPRRGADNLRESSH